MKRTVRKLNNRVNSIAITLPKYIVSELSLAPGQMVDVYFKDKKIIIDTDCNYTDE